jgi:multidrug resistance efflux pump
MAITSLRTRVRADNLTNQVRPGQSMARRIYLGALLLGAGWIGMQFAGPMMFMDADGLVIQEREVVAPAFAAQVVTVDVNPGAFVRRGQVIGTVMSAQMLEQISDLTLRQSQWRLRRVQIDARAGAIRAVLPAADKRATDAESVMLVVNRAKVRGFTTVTRQAQVSQERYAALQEATSLRAELAGLVGERLELGDNLARVGRELTKASATYHDGTITAPVDGTIGPKVVVPGTTLGTGDNFAEIHHGTKYVVAYVPTNRFYAVSPGEQVVITDGVNRQMGHILRVEVIADKVPAEFQSGFRSVDRQQVVRVVTDDLSVFPLMAKIKVSNTYAFYNLLGDASQYVMGASAPPLSITPKTVATR